MIWDLGSWIWGLGTEDLGERREGAESVGAEVGVHLETDGMFVIS